MSDKYLDSIATRLDDNQADALLAKLLKRRPLHQLKAQREARTGLASIAEFTEPAEERLAKWGQMQGISTGYPQLDRMTMGLVPGELLIVGGQTSHGKTQLASNIAYRVARTGVPVLFVTLEMTKVELTARFMKIAEPVDVTGLPLLYQRETEVGPDDINGIIAKAKAEGVGLVVIDHLHYFVRSVEFASSEIGKIVKEFKRAAIEYEVPIMLLSHVRKIQKGTIPDIDDLRDSSFIGQDADIVLMVWRNMDAENGDPNDVRVGLLKNRNRGLRAGARQAFMQSTGAELLEVGTSVFPVGDGGY